MSNGSTPVSAHDVAAYILEQTGELSAMKLQKLVYYSQAWSLVWDDAPLFTERIEAWANGPVVRELYEKHRGNFSVRDWQWGNSKKLSADQIDTVNVVLGFYNKRNAQELSDMTHRERPWRVARIGLDDGDRGHQEITLDSMMEYYSTLQSGEQA